MLSENSVDSVVRSRSSTVAEAVKFTVPLWDIEILPELVFLLIKILINLLLLELLKTRCAEHYSIFSYYSGVASYTHGTYANSTIHAHPPFAKGNRKKKHLDGVGDLATTHSVTQACTCTSWIVTKLRLPPGLLFSFFILSFFQFSLPLFFI
jgi:hypothetical protein